jgi:hypothetical protein
MPRLAAATCSRWASSTGSRTWILTLSTVSSCKSRNTIHRLRRCGNRFGCLTGRPDAFITVGVESFNVVNWVALAAFGFLVIRAVQATTEHYFPGSEPTVVMRFLFGGPS